MNKNNVEKVVCEFAQRSTPVENLVTSKNDKLCQIALKQHLAYVKFDQSNELTYESVQEAGFYGTTPTDSAAQVDINNDGKTELVVGLELASGAGRGCDGEHLGVLSKKRDKLDMSITRLLPEPLCGGVKQTPFVFEGQTYIEILYPSGHPSNNHQVVQLRQGKLETVCQYDVRVVNYVLGEYERILENAESAYVDPWIYVLKMPGTSGLQVMLDAKHDIRIKDRNDAYGTVLHEAIRGKRYDALQYLLEHGADPNVKTSNLDDMPTLIFAIWQSSIEGMRLLLKHGANSNQMWGGQPARAWVNFWVKSATDKTVMLDLLSKK